MPIYEYVCDDCGERYERIVMNAKQSIACPKCASGKKTIQLSVFAAPSKGGKTSASSSGSSTSASSGGGCGCTPRTCGCH
jgi:putative FmdB family regulatory protein